MIAVLALGALFGIGLLVVGRSLVPAPPPLEEALSHLHRRPDLVEIANKEAAGLSGAVGERVGPRLGRLLSSSGLVTERLQTDLALLGRPLEQHYGEKVVLAVFGLLLPTVMAVVMAAGGVAVGLPFPLLAGLLLAIVFFFVPDLTVRSQAEARRRDFRHALGSFLDLVVIGLAGGAGVESALADAASIGRGWAFTQLRNALEVTKLTGETPWAALARLGDELGVPELPELAASVSLAGTEGARVRGSLAAKAESLRDHTMATQEAEAQSETEKMALPVVLLFVGFLVLIGYPAVDAVMTGI